MLFSQSFVLLFPYKTQLSILLILDVEPALSLKSNCPSNLSTQILFVSHDLHSSTIKSLLLTLKYFPPGKKSLKSLQTLLFKTIQRRFIKTHVRSSFSDVFKKTHKPLHKNMDHKKVILHYSEQFFDLLKSHLKHIKVSDKQNSYVKYFQLLLPLESKAQ